MSLRPVFLVAFVLLAAILGCSDGQQEWQVTVVSFSEKGPADVHVTLGADGKSTAEVKQFQSNAAKTMISGRGTTIVNTITVVQKDQKKVHAVNEKLPGGKVYRIIIEADGTVNTKIE